jgi:hypothetical protein
MIFFAIMYITKTQHAALHPIHPRGVMYKAVSLLLIIVNVFCVQHAFSQRPDTTIIYRNDTIIELVRQGATVKKLEGRKLEDILKDYSEKNLFSRKLHEWLVKTSFDNEQEAQPDLDKNLIPDLSEKQIAHIDIRHIDPFGGSINDTVSVADSWLAELGNRLSFETASGIILKTITFKKEEHITLTDISDSERLLRALSFINDTRIVVWPHPSGGNHINVSIYVQDRYPHAISIGVRDHQPRISLINKNILGRGISLEHTLVTPSTDIRDWSFKETLGAENFLAQYVDFKLDYSHLRDLQLIGANLEKEFVLPEIKYAGGITLNRSYINPGLSDYTALEWDPPLNYRRQNFWIGRSFLLDQSFLPLRSNIYFTARFMDLKIFNNEHTPEFIPDGKFYYSGIAFSRRGYYKNNLIYSFGRTEDVPYGSLTALSIGHHDNNNGNRQFLGFHQSLGKALIPSKGYIYFSGDIGSFFRSGSPEQGYLRLSSEYITPLISVGSSQLRNFFEIQYVNGLNRFMSDYLYIDEDVNGLHRFDYNETIRGSEKALLKTEQVFFTRLEPLGFKFAIFSFFDMAFLREKNNVDLFNHTPYFSFGGGLRIRNDKLVFNTLQIQLSIMPRVPSGQLPFSLRTTGETTKDFSDFVPPQPGTSAFY